MQLQTQCIWLLYKIYHILGLNSLSLYQFDQVTWLNFSYVIKVLYQSFSICETHLIKSTLENVLYKSKTLLRIITFLNNL